ncbi:hypothetical protein ACIA8F_06025 [Streptomyces sp. NPDC051563]|uniref:hypothetical protein n=1 Tax=Streptomyces sp. NPDC051563 TaxID=3365659 RepID=UPI0037BB4BCC
MGAVRAHPAPAPARRARRAAVELPGRWRLALEEPLASGADRLRWVGYAPPAGSPEEEVPVLLRSHGRPTRYACTEREQTLSAYQTVFAMPRAGGAGAAEMPAERGPAPHGGAGAGAGAPGGRLAPLTLHTGVASQEAHEPPYSAR